MPNTPLPFKSGFTLIELIISVSLVAILGGVIIGVLNPQTVSKKARDSQRISNLKAIQTGIELYRSEKKKYPIPCTAAGSCFYDMWIGVNGTTDRFTVLLVPDFMSTMPNDPLSSRTLAPDNPCVVDPVSPQYGFNYKTNTTGSQYMLTAQMELASSAVGNLCSQESFSGCSVASPMCYGIPVKAIELPDVG